VYLSGRDPRKDRVTLHLLEVVGYPVDNFMAILAKGLSIHGRFLSYRDYLLAILLIIQAKSSYLTNIP
jgi:hypothetical protein